jgi:hypothetical protein
MTNVSMALTRGNAIKLEPVDGDRNVCFWEKTDRPVCVGSSHW